MIMDAPAKGLGAQPAVDQPLLKPGAFERAVADAAKEIEEMRKAKGRKSDLSL